MMMFRISGVALLLLGFALVGCGGGNAGNGNSSIASTGSNTQSDQPFQFGALSGRAAINNPPLTANGNGSTVTAIQGDISSLFLNDPAPNLAETRIAFILHQEGNYELYTMNADGSNPVRLTNSPGNETSPCWHPDGSRLVFASGRTGNDQIYIITANGSSTVRLTNNAFNDEEPCYSPDGSKIAFSTNRDGNFEIYVMNANGSNPQRLTNDAGNDDGTPRWSPDGKKIAWVKITGSVREIWTMDANGLNQSQLTHDGAVNEWPAWSPDSTRIAFASYRNQNWDIYEINADGDGNFEARLTTGSNTDTEPNWSPDGSKIAFNSDRDGNSEIYIMNPDGSNQTRLTNNLVTDGEPAWGPLIKQRTLIGAGSVFGPVAANGEAGFLFSRGNGASGLYGSNGDVVNSVVIFDANSRSGIILNNQSGTNNTGPELVFTVETDSPNLLNRLAFVNNPDYRPNFVIGTGSTLASANGALMDFSSATGKVTAVLPFSGTRAVGAGKPTITESGGQRVFRGYFLGVWDGTGKNLAPQGASEVHVDLSSNQVTVVK